MKRRLLAAFLCFAMTAGMLTACGKKPDNEESALAVTGQEVAEEAEEAEPEDTGEGVTESEVPSVEDIDLSLLINADPSEYIKLPDIASVSVTVAKKQEVTDEMVEEEFKTYEDRATTLESVKDRDTVQDGDIVSISYSEKNKTGETAPGDGYNIEIGAGTFTENVDQGLIGMKKGETKTIKFKYPDDYYDDTLKGVDTEFTVTVNDILYYDKKEINDDTIREFELTMKDGTAVDTVDKLREYVRETLEESAEQKYRYNAQSEALIAVEKETENIKDYPEEMVKAVRTYMLAGFGMKESDIDEAMSGEMDNYAKDYIREQLVVEAISREQNIGMTNTDVVESMKEFFGDNAQETYDSLGENDKYAYTMMAKRDKAADYILSKAKITEVDADTAQEEPVSGEGLEEEIIEESEKEDAAE